MRTWGITSLLSLVTRRPTRPVRVPKWRPSPDRRARSTRFLGSFPGRSSLVKIFVHIDLIPTNSPTVDLVPTTSAKPLIATNIRVGYVSIPLPDIMR